MDQVTKLNQGWIIPLTDAKVAEIKEAHYRVEGLNAIVANSVGDPTDTIIIKLGEASAKLKDLGMNIAAENIPELKDADIPFNWSCDFENKELVVTLV